MIIIPTLDAPNGAAEADKLLKEVFCQRRRVTCFIFGDTAAAREVASRADVRAEDHPARQVVWVPDERVLNSADAVLAPLQRHASPEGRAVFFNLDSKLSAILIGADARSFAKLEVAFARALAGDTA